MKNKILTIFIFISIILLATSCSRVKDNKEDNEKSDFDTSFENKEEEEKDKVNEKEDQIEEELEEKDEIKEKIEFMTLEEKIGQLLIVGFEGTRINEDIEVLINNYKVGGFIFFSRNITDSNLTFKLINDIKEKNMENGIPLFISIDEEGGRVSRLPNDLYKLPPAKKIGDINKSTISFGYGKIIGESLKAFGFNLDFAPVLDINSNPDNPVIGDRAFGSEEENVTKNSMDVIDGLNEEEIIPVVKHFPGHGDTDIDSHKSLPIVYKTRDELENLELIPFKKAIDRNISSIMVAHILFDKIDPQYPATMSKKIITNLLREDLNFDGVVFSDDMTMGAIIENYSLEDASIKFLESGGDILLICHGKDNPKLVFEAIKKSVNDKIINENDIDKKVYRILSLKEGYNINDKKIQEFNLEEVNRNTEEFLMELQNK